MEENETRFDNMLMPAFSIPFMFRSVGKFNEMGYTMGCEKGPEKGPKG